MRITKQQIWATIVALIGGGAIALTYLDSGANVIAKYGHLLPDWAHDHRTLPIVFIVLATGLVIAIILAPRRSRKSATSDRPASPEMNTADQLVAMIDRTLSRAEQATD